MQWIEAIINVAGFAGFIGLAMRSRGDNHQVSADKKPGCSCFM
jgi:hypothetical protein